MRSTTAASTWMNRWPRSRCIGYRVAPLGSVEAMASEASSVRTTRIISRHLVPAERYFRGPTLLPGRVIADDAQGRCRHVANTGATSTLSVSRSDLDIDRQVQLDETRLQQRHGQVIVQFNPGVGVAWRPSELLEDDLAGLPKR
jgi:hypothetical protein